LAEQFLELEEKEKRSILVKYSSRLNLSALAIEKDIWVCWVLQVLFSMEGRPRMAFKGGTSLSKIFGAIARFSEDVDVTIDHQTWKHSAKDPFSPQISRTQINKISEEYEEKTREFVQGRVVPTFEKEATILGVKGLRIEFDGKEKMTVVYPTVMEDLSNSFDNRYMMSNVLVEFGGKNSILPNNPVGIVPEISALMPGLIFPSVKVDVLAPERTFWEKATLIHVECNRPSSKESYERLSRHWYDLWKLESHSIGVNALQNFSLLEDVVKYKKVFFHSSHAKYEECLEGRFKLYPENGVIRNRLADDYEKMRRSGMFREDPPSFDEVMNRMKNLESRINQGGWSNPGTDTVFRLGTPQSDDDDEIPRPK